MALARRPEGQRSDEEEQERHDAERVDQLEERVALRRACRRRRRMRAHRSRRARAPSARRVICRRGRSATGGARSSTAAMAPASRSRSGDSGPGTPSCGQLPAKGVRKIAALSVYAGSMRHTTTAIDTTATAATAGTKCVVARSACPAGMAASAAMASAIAAAPTTAAHDGARAPITGRGGAGREKRAAARARAPAAIPPSRPTKTRDLQHPRAVARRCRRRREDVNPHARGAALDGGLIAGAQRVTAQLCGVGGGSGALARGLVGARRVVRVSAREPPAAWRGSAGRSPRPRDSARRSSSRRCCRAPGG